MKKASRVLCTIFLILIFSATALAYSGEPTVFQMLIGPKNSIDADYVPDELVALNKYGIKVSTTSIKMTRQAAVFASQLFAEMESIGLGSYVVVSGYRTYAYQSTLFENKTNSLMGTRTRAEAEAVAATSVARPGTSEHQTGMAMDISSSAQGGTLTGGFAATEVGKWMGKNSYKYGFIVRYPESKTNLTGVIFEPWHFRYVGYPHAAILNKMNLCLEEYYDYLKGGMSITHTDDYGITYIVRYETSLDNVSDAESVSLGDGKGYIVTRVVHEKGATVFRWD